MLLFSFLLFYKAFSFLSALVLSCSPENYDGNFISISLSILTDSRFNVNNFLPNPGTIIICYNSGFNQPDINEIFMLKQPITGAYEFLPFIDFYRTKTIEMPTASIKSTGVPFDINFSTGGDNQRFSIECDVCNLNINSANWTKYHTSCLITVKNSILNN